ncbi:hypothetical protein KIN20_030677 [Parelaphostrongylus tenuis]|uniref:Uncharacterized protein n=1 Tax=Parelaphostrongylus tenuis TaxID=148309 RepID=A0AAD5WGK6_PARTN|nr:hypothetical protein KIN20_030677 [Parelaphostrongylus tenuis]
MSIGIHLNEKLKAREGNQEPNLIMTSHFSDAVRDFSTSYNHDSVGMWSACLRSSKHKDFTVSGFSLPVAMIYVETSAESVRVSGIAANKGGAQTFVQRLVMQTVFDVLESQGRAAFHCPIM